MTPHHPLSPFTSLSYQALPPLTLYQQPSLHITAYDSPYHTLSSPYHLPTVPYHLQLPVIIYHHPITPYHTPATTP